MTQPASPQSLVREVAAALDAVLARADEKGAMLMAHMGVTPEPAPKGLAEAVRRLRRSHDDDQIRAAAASLAQAIALRYDPRERLR